MSSYRSLATSPGSRLAGLGGLPGPILVFGGAFGLVLAASLLAVNSAWLSGGTLIIWPADGLIIGLMAAPQTRRPWLIYAAGLLASLLAFSIVGRQMVLGVTRIAVMSVEMPIVYLWIKRAVRDHSSADARVLLPFLAVCGIVVVPIALLRSVIVEIVWGIPVGLGPLNTWTSTFVGYAVFTPLILLIAQPSDGERQSPRARATMWAVVVLYTAAMTGAFLESRYPTVYLIPVALILVAHIVDFTAILVVILTTAAISVGLTFTGHGAISHFPADLKTKVLMTRAFLCVVVAATLPFSAMRHDRERLRRSISAALEAATNASQAKSAFLAMISHEIRTPLNGVMGMAQAMELDELTPVQRKRLAVVRQSSEGLLALLNDVLDLSKIEAGKITLETIPFDPVDLVDAIVAQNGILAFNKGLTIQAETVGLEGLYEGDPNRIRQIIQNLVSNAIKFTESGCVAITATGSATGLTIQVRDTGMGVPAGKLGKLFEKFQQVDESTTRRFGGTGLGLSICRELARAMGGDVTVESKDGEGSTFIFTAPLPRSTQARVEHAGTPAQYKGHRVQGVGPAGDEHELELRVLAAEDNPTNQLVLKTLLGAAGIEPTIVGNGAEAVAAWRDGDWDVILMDVQMPVMDGPTAARLIRQEEAAGARTRTMIVALTANTMDHQVREYLDNGMDGYLPKPISIEKLFALLSEVENKRASGQDGLNSAWDRDDRVETIDRLAS
jgi:signal transduction histidine kinase/FixJ family two-component response regulator